MELKELYNQYEDLKRQQHSLEYDYNYYKSYFENRTFNEAESKHYSDKLDETCESESRFNAYSRYISLSTKMKDNRNQRKVIYQKLKDLKKKIKNYNKN